MARATQITKTTVKRTVSVTKKQGGSNGMMKCNLCGGSGQVPKSYYSKRKKS